MIPTATTLISVKHDRARFTLHPGQTRPYKSTRRFTFVVAGTQSGKTSFGPLWLRAEIERAGAGDYLAATATFDLFKLKMLPEMKYFFCTLQGWQWVASDRTIVSPSGKTRIILRSANAEGGLESATAKAAWLDECGQDAFRLEAWQAVQRRLSLSQGRVLGTTTPYNLGWLKTEVYDRWRAQDPDYQIVQFASTMNPAFPLAEFERARRVLPDWKFRMFYEGEFTRPAGLIYADFDESIQLVDDFSIPPDWPRWVGADFGGAHTSLVWLAQNPAKDVYYLYRESLEGGLSTREHAAKALEFAQAENVVFWAGGAKSETQQRMDWQSNGVPLREPQFADVEAGIDRVTELIKTRRLFVFRSCVGTRDELGTYAREVDEYGLPTAKIKDKEKFHRLDALRYIAQHIVGGMSADRMVSWA
jgi:hypothetical protein